jgi:YHS domain-containing protein
MAIDPVCLMEVEEATAKWTSEYQGKTYYFCAPGCKFSFEENPAQYLAEGKPDSDQGAHHEHHAQ